jgi:hypothetical protein
MNKKINDLWNSLKINVIKPSINLSLIVFGLFVLFILSSFFVEGAGLNDNLIDYWSFNQNNFTGDISKTGTNTLTTANTTSGVIGNSRNFYTGQSITMPTNASYNNPAFSYCYFVHFFGNLKDTNRPGIWKGTGTSLWLNWAYENSGSDIVDFAHNGLTDAGVILNTESGTYKEYANYSGVWTSYCFRVNSTNASISVNGSLAVSESKTGSLTNDNSGIIIGKYSSSYLIGQFDEIAYWDRFISDAEVLQYYNNVTSGQGYPFPNVTIPAPPNSTILNVSIDAKNYYNQTFQINNFTLEFNDNGTLYTSTNGLYILLNYNISNLINISLTNVNNHYDINYTNVNLSLGTYTLLPVNILNFTNFTIYNTGSFNYNVSVNLSWSTPSSIINSSIARYNVTLVSSDGTSYLITNDTSTNITVHNFINYFDTYNLVVTVIDSYGLTSTSTSAINVRGVLTPCNQSIVLNTTGITLNFELINMKPLDTIALRMGSTSTIADVLPAPVTFYTYKTTVFDGFNYNNYTTGFNGVYSLYVNDADTLCTLTACRNNYVRITQPCSDNLRYVNYSDTNNCALQYDLPTDIGTYEDCVISASSDTDRDLWLILLFVLLTAFGIALSFTITPLIIIVSWVSGIALMYYSNIYFSTPLLGIMVLLIVALSTFVSVKMKMN